MKMNRIARLVVKVILLIVLFEVLTSLFFISGTSYTIWDSHEVVTTNEKIKNNNSNSIAVYKTMDEKEFLSFLEKLSKEQVISCSVGNSSTKSSTKIYFMVTYKKINHHKKKRGGDAFLFRTSEEDEYKGFIENLDTSKYEILGTGYSDRVLTYWYIIFREIG